MFLLLAAFGDQGRRGLVAGWEGGADGYIALQTEFVVVLEPLKDSHLGTDIHVHMDVHALDIVGHHALQLGRLGLPCDRNLAPTDKGLLLAQLLRLLMEWRYRDLPSKLAKHEDGHYRGLVP